MSYRTVIEKVKTVNRQAALIMAKQLKLQNQRERTTNTRFFLSLNLNIPDLFGAFVWEKTRQGHEYWYKISRELGELS